MVACCHLCPHCGRDRIPTYIFDKHVEECKKENPDTPYLIPAFNYDPSLCINSDEQK